MLPVENLFGGATTLPSGMVNSPLLAGYGSQQNMQDQFQNQALNQQAQQTQNDTAANTLQQQLLDNPNLAAQRQVTAGNLGVQQSLIDSGQQLAAQGAQLDAKTQKALADMSDSQMEVVKNHSAAYMQAYQYAQQDPSASMPGSSGNKAMLKILSDANIKDVPDTAGPDEMQTIKARAMAAPATIQQVQALQQGAQKIQGEQAVEATKAGSAANVANIGAQAHVEAATITAQAQKSMESVAAQIIKRYNADPSSVNSREIADVQANLVKTAGYQVLSSISTQMGELNNLNAKPEEQAKARTNVLMNNVPGYAQMEAIRLQKITDEAKQGNFKPASAYPNGAKVKNSADVTGIIHNGSFVAD